MKIFQREQRSLFGEILDWMLTPLLLLWPVSLVLIWLVAQNVAGKPFDRALEYNVGELARLVTVKDHQVQFNLPLPARELLRAQESDLVYYQVLGAKGEYLSGERDLPAPEDDEKPFFDEVRLRDASYRGSDVKIAYTWVRLDMASERPALVQVAETLDKRAVLATEIVKGVMLPQFVILPLTVLLVWLGLVYATRPLNQLEERIRARRPDDLSPLDYHAIPQEVVPLVSSVNDLLMRLKNSISNQKRFLADAAHQLKTPLAGLRMQADLALREGASADDLKQSLRQIGRASERATHTVNQLLALARAEDSHTAMASETCDLSAITIDVVQDCLARALDKDIDLGYEGAQPGSTGVALQGNATLLKEMVRNLLDNAINYTPSSSQQPGMVTARVLADPKRQLLSLQVEDSGAGIPASERDLVFQPFYRSLGNEAEGSGLGLPIVVEIAMHHGARVTLDDARPGHLQPGCLFTVRFGGEPTLVTEPL
ncbi:MAG: sensor histidine kinase N-terminal domain-containing protein [Burkholderiaceae bacterium]